MEKIFTNSQCIDKLKSYVGKEYNYTYSISDIVDIFLNINEKYAVTLTPYFITVSGHVYIDIREQFSDIDRKFLVVMRFKCHKCVAKLHPDILNNIYFNSLLDIKKRSLIIDKFLE